MEDKRFDSLTKALASGANRRSVLKGLLGLGAAAATSGVLLDDGAEAARRPTPTPTPHKCPGNQTWNGTKCICPTGLSQCVPGSGPACCNDQNVDPGEPGYSTCCDNACCQGTCYDEERCCPTNARPGEQPPTNRICETTDGPECCLFSDVCCLVDGCCATVCTGGSRGIDTCCASDDFCPGGNESPDLCCAGNTICCDGGANTNACVDLGNPSACCVDADCDTPPSGSTHCAVGHCVAHTCQYTDCNASTEVCCPNNREVYACRVGDECCLTNADCADTCEACVNFVCIDDPNTFPCGPTGDPDKFCCPGANYSICCPGAKGECCGVDDASDVTRDCQPDGACCPLDTPNYCAGSGSCCSVPCVIFSEAEYCCDPEAGRICPNASSFVCCPNGQECSEDGDCCPPGTVACGDACCPVDNICCPVITEAFVPVSAECCPTINQCTAGGQCCPAGSTVCDGDCCSGDTPQCCNGVCVAASVECCSDTHPCDGACEVCRDGACQDDNSLCAGTCGICVDGACQPDPSACLACETCTLDDQTDSYVCVDDCTGCAECQASQINPAGNCFPIDSECLSCQVCFLNDSGNGGACESTCGGCGNCVENPSTGAGVCVADDDLCNVEGEICCPAGENFSCEAGPSCGCDPDCTGCATCVDGVCVPGDCFISCYGCVIQPNGSLGICEDTCTGCTECRIANGIYACRPKFGNPCPSCEICQVNGDGTGGECVDNCPGDEICCTEGGTGDCCPPGLCIEGAGCCPDEDICGSVCCGDDETCCNGSDCVNLASDPNNCSACGVSCSEPPTVCFAPGGSCFDSDCFWRPLDIGTSCGDCLVCDGAGSCIESSDPCCGVPCDLNACLTCQGGTCVDFCSDDMHCTGSGTCVPNCVPGGTCAVNDDCCGGNLCCQGTCLPPDSACGQCLSTCNNDSSKCCCFHPGNGNYDCANRNGCDNGEGHFCVN